MSYESASSGSLKLKGVSDKKIKKKHKKSTSKQEVKNALDQTEASELINSINKQSHGGEVSQAAIVQLIKPPKTKAELAYERSLEKRVEEKILQRAEKSHKERVELYNKHLDSLSEYNDIPKVSWTK